MKLEELQVYDLSMSLGERIWDLVEQWGFFQKITIGKQLVRAADSIAANLSEGFGRFFFKENKQFCYYSRGSLFETKTWIVKAHRRGLINKGDFGELNQAIETIGRKLNSYINSIGSSNQKNA